MEIGVITILAWLLCSPALVWGDTMPDLLAETPQCAVPCLVNSVTAASCSVNDIGQFSSCICTNHTLLASQTTCVRLACEIPDQVRAQAALGQLCQAFPVDSQVTYLKAMAILSIVVAVLSITMRWIARYQTTKFGWDDYTALGAALFLIASATVQLDGAILGFGLHAWNVNPTNAIRLLQQYWASQMLYIFDQMLIKVTTLALYTRVFPTVLWLKTTIRLGIVIIIIQETIYIFCVMLRCTPLAAIWDIRVTGRCLNLNAIGLSGAIAGIVEHFAILALPLPELWKLKLSRRKRIQLALVFSIGSFSCITSLIRLHFIGTFTPTDDASWDTIPVVVWSLIECLSAMICINLPPCRHFISKLFPGSSAASTTTKRQHYYNNNPSTASATANSRESLFFGDTLTGGIGISTRTGIGTGTDIGTNTDIGKHDSMIQIGPQVSGSKNGGIRTITIVQVTSSPVSFDDEDKSSSRGLDTPTAAPRSPTARRSLKRPASMTDLGGAVGSEDWDMTGVEARRPYTAASIRTLDDVGIDYSETGLIDFINGASRRSVDVEVERSRPPSLAPPSKLEGSGSELSSTYTRDWDEERDEEEA